ncbi:ATP-dependent Clp protease proteolytic subunit [Variovorax sp. PAMC28562]|uniref:COG3904 family protein n=1 Tax=Variovorax sp. PAMC28562 TaxID=2762323 RepID=UPI00164D43DC|nr:ATP-dependent Clp protease proteolytic subunit [Variovorax sp. PAMC28562]QNK72706.1 ATP-dependent Clp protease proteolytic subunit [Variovorax sp. PAMC28562]
MKTFRYALCCLALLVLGTARAAIGYDYKAPTQHPGKGLLSIWLTGQVGPADLDSLLKADGVIRNNLALNDYARDDLLVLINLDSIGGNVSTALAIGRYIRALKSASTTVAKDAKCFSSCVFILAGATNRAVDGKIGIHRPYEPNDATLTPVKQKEKYDKLGVELTSYLKEMNVPVRLYEDMLFISPERMKILTSDEQEKYGLNVSDPYFEEAQKVMQAQGLGISRLQLAQREARQNVQCPDKGYDMSWPKPVLLAFLTCRDEVLHGLR